MAAIDDITNLYTGYFNRAPDPAGLNFWINQRTAGASLAGIANSFSQVPEATNLYGFLSAPTVGSSTSFLASLYLNLFNRVIDAPGSAFWAGQLALPGAIVGQVIINIISGAQGNDALVVANKSAVGKYFAAELTNKNLAFNTAALAASKTAFNGVTSDVATVAPAQAAIDTAFSGTGTVGSIAALTFNLTTGTDVFVGGTGNDLFNGIVNGTAAQTFTSVDNLDGGAGTGDVLNSLHEGAGGNIFPNGPINNIEIFNIRNLNTGGALAINAGNINGETAFNFDRGTAVTTVTNLAAGTTIGIIGDGLTSLGASNIGFAGTEATSTLNISNGTGAATGLVTYTGSAASAAASPTALTINSTGAANSIGGLTLGAGTTSLTINAATNLTLTAALTGAGLTSIKASGAAAAVSLGTAAVAAGVTSIDASGLTTGGITAILNTGVSSFKGGVGSDTVTTAALSGAASIDAGAGTADRLNVAATTDVDTAAEAAQYKGFDVLSLGVAATTVKVDDFTNSTITSLRAGADNLVFNGVSSTQAAAVTVFGGAATNLTFVVNGSGVSGSDVLNLAVNDGAAAVSTITLAQITAANIEAINFAATDNITVTSMTGASGFTGSTITGTGNINITTGALALTSNSTFFNASAVGGVVNGTVLINAGAATAFGVSITGSTTYANTLTGTVLADTLVGGAGNDFLNNRTAGAATAADLLTGLGGQDTFQLFGAVASGAIPAVYNTAARISDFGVTASSATTDILALSATPGNYTGASAFNASVAAAAAGATTVLSVGQTGATAVGTTDLIKLTTGVVAGVDTQVTFNAAIGAATVTGLTASSEIFASYYDTTNSRAVILVVNPTDADTVIGTGDVVTLVGTINMSAADYATFGTNQLAIVA